MFLKNQFTFISTVLVLLLQSSIITPKPSKATQPIIAQNNRCRQVNTNTYINVKNKPTGLVIGRLEDDDIVYVEAEYYNNWARISHPVAGYISTDNLVYCTSNSSINQPVRNTTLRYEPLTTVPGSNCRRVNEDRIMVRNKPNGRVVGQLTEDQQVTLANEGYNGWVPIEYPVNGYISAEYLTDCDKTATVMNTAPNRPVSTVLGTNCRQIMSPDVPVRAEPMGDIIGTLDENKTVYIANEGYDGWVPVERPMSGYVTSANLGDCQSINY